MSSNLVLSGSSQPVTHPSYGDDLTAELEEYDEYYDEEEGEGGLEPDKALAKVQEYLAGDENDYETSYDSEMWPSAVPNRLGEPQKTKDGEVLPEDYRLSTLGLPLSLPYEVETLAEMDERLEVILKRLLECVKAREFGYGFQRWDAALSQWIGMGYPMKKEIKKSLIFLYYEILFLPTVSTMVIDDASSQFVSLVSDRSFTVWDFRIPWRPLYDALYESLFPPHNRIRKSDASLAPIYLNVAEAAQRFFHPGEVDEMLETILPRFDSSMNSILATQAFLVHFLPITHCQKWLPVIFRLWYGFNSGLWDDQASDLLGQLSITHVVPTASDPSLIDKIPRGTFNTPEEEKKNPGSRRALRGYIGRQLDVAGEVEDDVDGVTYFEDTSKMPEEIQMTDSSWPGIRKDIGIFTEQEFEFLMTKALRSLNVPVGGALAASNSMSVTAADARASSKILDAKKPIDRIQSLAETIVYCISEDATAVGPSPSGMATPSVPPSRTETPVHSAINRLQNGSSSMHRGNSSDSLATAGKKSDEHRKYLGGSKALDHMARLLTSCETFFHPSNSGHWSAFLNVFLLHLTTNFLERWKAEEEPTCKTPVAWRLTPEIRRQFVLSLRPLALTAMFDKGPESMTSAVSTLKKLALLEPDLIMPALMERAVPSLQGLEETLRTPAVTYSLAILCQHLASRRIWRIGGVYVSDIFTLLLPGIDLNDPTKTALSSMAISNIVDIIRMSDVSEVEGGGNIKAGPRALRTAPRLQIEEDPDEATQNELSQLSPDEVNERVKMSTAVFRDWVPEFIGRVLLLFSNLPEEGGKTGRAGGKSEAMTLASVLHTCGGIFEALDDKLFDAALEQVFEYATSTCQASAVNAVGELVRNLAAARGIKVFAKFFPVCRQRILAELQAGASSTRSQTTLIPVASDAALHWWQSILAGSLIPGRVSLSSNEYRKPLIELIRSMIGSTYSERGWNFTGRIIEKTMTCLTAVYFKDLHMVNSDEYASEDFMLNHHLYWGRLYRPAEVKLNWAVPTADDIDMALDLVTVAEEATIRLNQLLDHRSIGDQVWTNDFCRAINVVDKVLQGSYNLVLEIPSSKSPGKVAETYLPPEVLETPKPFKTSILLTDSNDSRYQRVIEVRHNIGEMLNRAATATRDAGESDNSVETIRFLVSAMGTLLTVYGMRSKAFSTAQSTYSALLASKKLSDSQRKQHRSVFQTAASVHNQRRLVSLGYDRVRSELDDRLISNLLEFCLSPFTRIRKSAQNVLDSVTKRYKGSWVLCYPALLDALQPGTDPDRMKGAIYVLRYNSVGIQGICRDWRKLPALTKSLLDAHHQNKESIQKLVAKATEELLGLVQEPTSFIGDVKVEGLDKATDAVVSLLHTKLDASVVAKIVDAKKTRIAHQDEQWNTYIDQLLDVAKNTTLNWRYNSSATRFLYAMIRRDRPTDVRLAEFFGENAQNPHPRLRDLAVLGFSRLAFYVALRSLCGGSEEKLFLQEPDDPLTKEIDLTDTSPAFTERYLASFREPLPKDESTVQLCDRSETGWLAWGRQMEVSRLSGWEEDTWVVDPTSKDGIEVFRKIISAEGWWQRHADNWAREEQRNYPSGTHIDFVLSLTQLYGTPVSDAIRPVVEAFLSEMESTKVYDRHKTRAMWELICGLIRGSEDWPGKDRASLWDWLAPRLPELFNNIRHDTVKCWDTSILSILSSKDPRRNKRFVDFCFETALGADFMAGSALDLVRRVDLARSLIRCLGWRFIPWIDDFARLYFKSFSCPYADVRALIASVINAIDQLKFHPSYPSAGAFVTDVLDDPNLKKDIMRIKDGFYLPQLRSILQELPQLEKERPHGPLAVQSAHDTTAMTTLMWMAVELTDVHSVGAFPYIIPILPEIFELRDLNDNPSLQRTAGSLLAQVPSITPSFDLIEPLMSTLISILQNSPSWRTRMHSMPVLSLVYFRNLALLSESLKAKCLDVVSACLKDPNQEVREMASATLSGFLRCSQRTMVVVLKDRFTREIDAIRLPKRKGSAPGQVNPQYQERMVELHGAILGATALVEAFPYTVPKFMPKLLADVLAPRVSEPAPISTTIRSCVASFKRTHEKYQDKFTEDELSSMNYAQAGNSYYA